MNQYESAFGIGYQLGLSIPEYFVDVSYKNDTGPSFEYVHGHNLLKICILPENHQEREIVDSQRYALMKMKTSLNDDYQEFVDIIFESDSPEEFQKLIFDQNQLISCLDG